MKIQQQHGEALQQLGKLIDGIGVAMLTTVDADLALVSPPMAPLEMDADGAIWFFTDRRSSKVAHLQAVNLSFADSSRATYVSLSGHGEIEDDPARIEHLWTPFARPWFPDGPQSPNLALLKVTPDQAEFWDAADSRMVRLLAVAASVVAAKPIGMGEHGRLDDL